jgi:cell division protein FtsB
MNVAIRRLLFAAGFVIIGVYGFVALRGPQGIPALLDKWRDIHSLEEQNATLQRENDYKKERIRKLQDSPAEQEMEIRKNLKLLRPGETTFILPEAPKPAEAAPAAK